MTRRWRIREDYHEAECEDAVVCYVNTPDGGVRVYRITPREIEGKGEMWAAVIAQDAESAIMSQRQSDQR